MGLAARRTSVIVSLPSGDGISPNAKRSTETIPLARAIGEDATRAASRAWQPSRPHVSRTVASAPGSSLEPLVRALLREGQRVAEVAGRAAEREARVRAAGVLGRLRVARHAPLDAAAGAVRAAADRPLAPRLATPGREKAEKRRAEGRDERERPEHQTLDESKTRTVKKAYAAHDAASVARRARRTRPSACRTRPRRRTKASGRSQPAAGAR